MTEMYIKVKSVQFLSSTERKEKYYCSVSGGFPSQSDSSQGYLLSVFRGEWERYGKIEKALKIIMP